MTGKLLRNMSPAERRAVIGRATAQIQAELQAAAPEIGRIMDLCTGTGRMWRSGMGRPICPVCHRTARSLNAPAPERRANSLPGWAGTVPEHEQRRR
jgi:hypothetical protein